MTITPDPITTAREALEVLLLTATQKAADRDACENAVSKYQTVRVALDYAEKLKAENERLTNKVQSQHDYMAPKYDAAMAELEKLKAERDEALCRLLSAGAEKPTAEDMDWAISLSASLRREEIAVEDSEITRLTSQLEQCKADDRKAMEVIERQKEEVFQANKMARDLEITAALLKIELEQAERVIKPFAEFVDCLDEELPDDEEYNTELGLDGYHSLTCGNFRDASQWIKDRQAKGEASC